MRTVRTPPSTPCAASSETPIKDSIYTTHWQIIRDRFSQEDSHVFHVPPTRAKTPSRPSSHHIGGFTKGLRSSCATTEEHGASFRVSRARQVWMAWRAWKVGRTGRGGCVEVKRRRGRAIGKEGEGEGEGEKERRKKKRIIFAEND